MLDAIGFSYVAPDVVLGMAVVAFMAAIVVGWTANAVLGDKGLGVVGNTLIVLAGTLATLALWNRLVARVTASDPMLVIGAIGAVAMMLLLLVAAMKRAQ